MADERETVEVQSEERKGFNRWLMVALAGAVLAGILLASSVWQGGSKDEGAGNQVAQDKAPDLEKLCAAQA